ncbi:MAG: efflux RND transporter periplasmic adaptor subunit [Bacteroidetes bacterium]|nr:efflux RND transporter periplasmic adaptor subunit [Bacteroidota bacterium]MBU2471925.1 efflux RND transporter periplasmic adaptor subunit [Bacteroidota bacterium]
MKTKILFLLTLFVLFIGCSKEEEKASDEIKPVAVSKAVKQEIQKELNFTGTINPWEEAALAAQMAARIKKIYVKEGDFVKQGTLLVQMDDAQLTQIELQYNDAAKDFERAEKLKSEGAISDQAYEKSKVMFETLKSNYDKILENTQLRAPFSGAITAKYLNDGELFLMAPSGGRSVPAIVHLMNLNELKIKISVPESDAYKLKIGNIAQITSDLLPNEKYTGTISRISPVVDQNTKTVQVDIRLINRGGKLKVGSFAKVNIRFGKSVELIIPSTAILTDPLTGESYVFVNENGKAKKKIVQTGMQFNGNTVIIFGLSENESVITTGQQVLKDGDSVQIFTE